MFLIPGKIIALLTFPGVIVHEWAHKILCNIMNVKVHEVKYFQIDGDVPGYVIHDEPDSFTKSVAILLGPFLVNSVLAVIFGAFALYVEYLTDNLALILITMWIGLSIGVHAFPSDDDGRNVISATRTARENNGSFLVYTMYPFIWLLYLANALKFIWFDFIYGLGIFAIGFWFGSAIEEMLKQA